MEIVWTKKAHETFNDVLDYLDREYSQKEVDDYINSVYQTISTIKAYPKAFQCVDKKISVRKAVVSPQNSLFYSIDSTQISLLRFWDNRSNPSSLKL